MSMPPARPVLVLLTPTEKLTAVLRSRTPNVDALLAALLMGLWSVLNESSRDFQVEIDRHATLDPAVPPDRWPPLVVRRGGMATTPPTPAQIAQVHEAWSRVWEAVQAAPVESLPPPPPLAYDAADYDDYEPPTPGS